jgi:glutamyl/glutaminyl-tRNA synthetase
MPTLTRYAPTPSGYLHPGNSVSFIITWALARAKGARILLRIDDLDRERCRIEYLENIFSTIDWLGLDYDEGPQSVSDFLQHWSQHHRLPHYTTLIEKLRTSGLVYACTCSRAYRREMIAGTRAVCTCCKKDYSFDATNTAWRIRVPIDASVLSNEKGIPMPLAVAELMGDFVIRQKDGLPAYQIASLADDMYFGVDFIVRGHDLLPSSAAQLYLSQLLGFDTFLRTSFYHHPLVVDEMGLKLSKSKGAGSLLDWQREGKATSPLFEKAAAMLGLSEVAHQPDELLRLLLAKGLS